MLCCSLANDWLVRLCTALAVLNLLIVCELLCENIRGNKMPTACLNPLAGSCFQCLSFQAGVEVYQAMVQIIWPSEGAICWYVISAASLTCCAVDSDLSVWYKCQVGNVYVMWSKECGRELVKCRATCIHKHTHIHTHTYQPCTHTHTPHTHTHTHTHHAHTLLYGHASVIAVPSFCSWLQFGTQYIQTN